MTLDTCPDHLNPSPPPPATPLVEAVELLRHGRDLVAVRDFLVDCPPPPIPGQPQTGPRVWLGLTLPASARDRDVSIALAAGWLASAFEACLSDLVHQAQTEAVAALTEAGQHVRHLRPEPRTPSPETPAPSPANNGRARQ